MARAENLDDANKGRPIGKAKAGSELPPRGKGVTVDNTRPDPLPDTRETERPPYYRGEHRR